MADRRLSSQAWGGVAERLETTDGIHALELNISCPNVRAGGVAFGVDPDVAARVVEAVRSRTSRTLIVKLSPNVTDITVSARSVEAAGADALSLINTLSGMAIDIETRRPKLANITGGLSGPAIKPIALRMVWQTAQAVGIPVVGVGGIMNTVDALEFLMVGATAIQVGTANFVDPGSTLKILDGMQAWLQQAKISDVKALIGTLITDG